MGARFFDQSKELILYLTPEKIETAPGDTSLISFTICNSRQHETSFRDAAGLRLPDGSPWPGNPIAESGPASIASSCNITGVYEFVAPPGLPPGTCFITAGVDSGGELFDRDRFEFELLENAACVE